MLVFDIETDGLYDNVSKVHCINLIDRSTGREYRFNDHEFYQDEEGNLTDVPTNRDGNIGDGLAMIETVDLGGQNITAYDVPVLEKLFDWTPKGKLSDTKIISKLMYPDLKDRDFAAVRRGTLPETFIKKGLVGSHKLESWGIRIGGQLKDDFNPKDYGHTWATMPFTQIFDDYCMQDVRTNVEIFEFFESKPMYHQSVVDLECAVAKLLHDQELNGVHFDEESAEKLVGILMPRRAEIEQQCLSVFHPWYAPDGKYAQCNTGEGNFIGNRGLTVPKRNNKSLGYVEGRPFTKVKQIVFNPASRDQIASRLTAIYGWQPIEKTDGGKPKVDETVLAALPYPEAKKLAEFFTINKRLGQIAEGKEGWLKKAKHGKIHGRVDTLGAVTNRMTHMSPNLAQVPANGAPYGVECRSLFTPRPGWKQVGMDADGLEGRCLGHYLYRWDNGAFIETILEGNKDDGTDLHSKNRDSVGLNGRDPAKTIFYAWTYGAGDHKLGSIYVDDMTEEQRDKFYAKFSAGRKRDAAIVRLGKRSRERLVSGITGMEFLLKAVKGKAKSGWLRAIDGRRLLARSQHAALNTLLQGMGAIVMKVALFEAHARLSKAFTYREDFAYLLNIHDEIQVECKPEIAEKVGQIMADCVAVAGQVLKSNCPLSGSFDIGDNWSETH